MRTPQEATPGTGSKLTLIYTKLLEAYGRQDWWPAESPFEVMVGAVLTQSASWSNVEKAIANLKAADALSPARLREMPLAELARLVYPSGYYNAKAGKLKALVRYLRDRYEDDLNAMFARDAGELRAELLSVHGIGEETADSILLYAAGKPVFVVDAYTRRIFSRMGLCSLGDSYIDIQSIFMRYLSPDTQLFNDYHALIVQHGKKVCRKSPLCGLCCVLRHCEYGQETRGTEVVLADT